jgi:hypothetical protein
MVWAWLQFREPTQLGPYPTFVDVGCPLPKPPRASGPVDYYVYWVGSHGSLWRCGDPLGGIWQQVPGPSGTVTRVAVSSGRPAISTRSAL